MLKGSIRVVCRIRPQLGSEASSEGGEAAISLSKGGVVEATSVGSGISKRAKSDAFTFSHTFGPDSKQEDMFTEISSLIDSALDGYHACIFAYGQTGSGKTYTMDGTPDQPGINTRSFQLLFEEIAKRSAHCAYSVKASMVEIYNEKLRDLLRESGGGSAAGGGGAAAAAGGVFIDHTDMDIRSGSHGMEIAGAIVKEIRTWSALNSTQTLLIAAVMTALHVASGLLRMWPQKLTASDPHTRNHTMHFQTLYARARWPNTHALHHLFTGTHAHARSYAHTTYTQAPHMTCRRFSALGAPTARSRPRRATPFRAALTAC